MSAESALILCPSGLESRYWALAGPFGAGSSRLTLERSVQNLYSTLENGRKGSLMTPARSTQMEEKEPSSL